MKVVQKSSPTYKTITPLKYLVMVMASILINPLSQADISQKGIGDLEIYQPAAGGQTNLMMMLDTSGSMGISSLVLPTNNNYGSPGDITTPLCSRVKVGEYYSDGTRTNDMWEWAYNLKDNTQGSPTYGKTSIYKSVTIGGEIIPYYVRGCSTGNTTQYDRLSRLKDSLITLMAGTQIDDKTVIGLGNFSSKTPLTIGNIPTKLVDGHSGRILVAAAPLTTDQRKKIAKAIASFQSLDTSTNEDGTPNSNLKLSSKNYPDVTKSSSGTPTAHAYAEAAAAMMGTGTGSDSSNRTSINYIYDGYMVKQQAGNDGQVYLICVQLGTTTTSALGATVKQCPSSWPSYDSSAQSITSSSPVYRPDGKGGWTKVTPAELKTQVGSMTRLWDIYTKLPAGWRLDGWMKVDKEPMDIEPIVGTVWGYGDGINGLVSYRTNPFSLSETNTSATDNTIGGLKYSISDSKKDDATYKKVATAGKCDANGIYFLTDGAPNSTKDTMAQTIMNTSLSSTYSISSKPTNGLISPILQSGLFAGETGGWEWIGEYAKRINDKTKNPGQVKIQTAIAGFGSSFTGLNKKADGTYDCDTASATPDARNACKWGQKGQGYGEGGFFYTQTSDDISNSVLTFVGSLNQTIAPTPSGTIVVPDDPYRADSQLAVAYYPTLQADVSHNPATWLGNVKKYTLNEGTLYGSDSQQLFTGIGGGLNANTPDLWSTNKAGSNNLVDSGGYSSQLPEPTNTSLNPTRTLWLEDFTTSSDQTLKLRKFSVNSSGRVTLDGAILSSSNTFNDTATYGSTTTALSTNTAQQGLLNFLGFSGFDTTKTLVDTIVSAPTSPTKIVGATIHSTPVAVSYSASLDSNGKVTSPRDDYAFFGSSDGAVHLVNADNASNNNGGRELFAFIPKTMIQNQSNALLSGGTSTKGIDNPYFGVDAPWLVSADYTYNFLSNQVSVATSADKGVFAYGGLRMGGTNLYGINITNYNAPSIMFDIVGGAAGTTGFSRMGQIWSQPTKAKMKISSSDKIATDVLIFGGGYDTCYENPNFQLGVAATSANAISAACAAKTQTQGNAVYIVNAKTGALIWSASSDSSANTVVPGMRNSIVGGITALDRNNDGITDNIYFADLGGQVFRADFKNGVVSTGTARVTRILKNTYDGTANATYTYRFYERPVVSFYRNPTTNTLFALVNVISGDRSSPLSTLRTDMTYADRLYGIIDSDVTKPDTVFYASNFTDSTNVAGQKIIDLTDNNFSALPTAIGTGTSFTAKQKADAINTMQSGSSRGWYYPLTRFDGYTNVPNGKGVGKSAVVGSYLYTTVYNPNMNYGNIADTCTAQIVGGSERELYCLPYGICTDSTSPTGTGGFARAGQGIQELTLGPRSSTLGNQRLLIGTQTLTQRAANRDDFNTDSSKMLATDNGSNGIGLKGSGLTQTGGDGSAAEFIFNERFALTPNTWFEVTK